MILFRDGWFTSRQILSIERHIAIRRVRCDPLERCAALTNKALQLHHVFENALNNEGELCTHVDKNDGNSNVKSHDSTSAMSNEDACPR